MHFCPVVIGMERYRDGVDNTGKNSSILFLVQMC